MGVIKSELAGRGFSRSQLDSAGCAVRRKGQEVVQGTERVRCCTRDSRVPGLSGWSWARFPHQCVKES